MHQGKTFLCRTLDLAAKVALCQEADLKYYTKTRDYTDVHILGGELVSISLLSHECTSVFKFLYKNGHESLAIYHSNTGVQLRRVTTYGLHTLKILILVFGFFLSPLGALFRHIQPR